MEPDAACVPGPDIPSGSTVSIFVVWFPIIPFPDSLILKAFLDLILENVRNKNVFDFDVKNESF